MQQASLPSSRPPSAATPDQCPASPARPILCTSFQTDASNCGRVSETRRLLAAACRAQGPKPACTHRAHLLPHCSSCPAVWPGMPARQHLHSGRLHGGVHVSAPQRCRVACLLAACSSALGLLPPPLARILHPNGASASISATEPRASAGWPTPRLTPASPAPHAGASPCWALAPWGSPSAARSRAP